MEKISVIMPIYNIEKYLKRALKCLINQTYSNLEIILIDDGSTDKSGKICDEYAKKDNRIKVIHQKNAGVAVSRNVGIKHATGMYIGFVDSDDIFSLDMYNILYQNMQKYSADISVCNYETFYENEPSFTNEDTVVVFSSIGAIEDIISDGILTNFLWNKLFKKELFLDINFPEGKIYEDMYVLPKIFEKVKKVCYTKTKLYGYFQRTNSYVNSYSLEKNENYLEVYNDIYNYLSKYPKLNEKLENYQLFCIYSAFLQAAKSHEKVILNSEKMKDELAIFRKKFKINKNFSIKRKILYYLLYINKSVFYKAVTLIK